MSRRFASVFFVHVLALVLRVVAAWHTFSGIYRRLRFQDASSRKRRAYRVGVLGKVGTLGTSGRAQ